MHSEGKLARCGIFGTRGIVSAITKITECRDNSTKKPCSACPQVANTKENDGYENADTNYMRGAHGTTTKAKRFDEIIGSPRSFAYPQSHSNGNPCFRV